MHLLLGGSPVRTASEAFLCRERPDASLSRGSLPLLPAKAQRVADGSKWRAVTGLVLVQSLPRTGLGDLEGTRGSLEESLDAQLGLAQ